MTRLGRHPLSADTLELVSLLLQVHHATHPQRLARRYGITPEYVRRQWRYRLEEGTPDMASTVKQLEDILAAGSQAAQPESGAPL